ncbi:MAG: DUF742 domain-containing protein [Acidimicrobiales bacterium]
MSTDDTALDDTALDDTALDDDTSNLVRPYALTRGRTRNERLDVSIQTVVCQSRASLAGGPPTGPVEHEIWAAAAARLSSADISARLDLPLGVVRVLVGDLAETGHLELGETVATGDAHLIKRLIDGIRAI